MKKNDPRLIAGHELEHHVFPTRQNKIENLKRERVKKRGCVKMLAQPFFYAQSPAFRKPGLCYYPKFL